jgi:hypothetical protein
MIRVFRPGRRYRHQMCLDTDIEVVAVSFKDSSRHKLKVNWYNRNWRDGMFVINNPYQPEKITIRADQYPFWDEVLPEDIRKEVNERKVRNGAYGTKKAA